MTAPGTVPAGYTGIQYTLDGGATWSDAIPAARDAGTYIVGVKYVGDDNHKDFIADPVTVTVAKADGDRNSLTDAQKPKANNLTYTGHPQPLVTAPSALPDGYGIQYSIDGGVTWSDAIPTAVEPGTYIVSVKYVGDGNHNDMIGEPLTASITVRSGGLLIATMVSDGDTSLRLSWTGVYGVGGYDIFFRQCDGNKEMPLIATVGDSDVTGYTFTGLAANKSYKAYVRAWIVESGSKKYVLNESPIVHAYTGNGTKKISNPGSLTLKNASLTVKLGKTKRIKATVNPVKKGKLKNHVAKLRYISSDPSVATVSYAGKVKGVGSGTCKIYVLTTNGIWDTVTVTVDANPAKVSILKPSTTMKVDQTQDLGLKVKLTPSKAISSLTWTSSNPDVATVDAEGKVKAIAKGVTVITVTASNGKKARVKITVK